MDDVLTNLIMKIILQYIHVSDYYIVHLLYCQWLLCYIVNYFSIKVENIFYILYTVYYYQATFWN